MGLDGRRGVTEVEEEGEPDRREEVVIEAVRV